MEPGAAIAIAMIISLSPFILWMVVQAYTDLAKSAKDNAK